MPLKKIAEPKKKTKKPFKKSSRNEVTEPRKLNSGELKKEVPEAPGEDSEKALGSGEYLKAFWNICLCLHANASWYARLSLYLYLLTG